MFLRGNLIKFKLVFVIYWKLCFFFDEEDVMYFLELKFIFYESLIGLSCCVCFDMCFEVLFLLLLDYFCVFFNLVVIIKVK